VIRVTGITFDPRTKLFVTLFASVTLMISLSWTKELIVISFLFLLFVLSGFWRKGLLFFGLFLLLSLADQFFVERNITLLVGLLDFFSVGYRRLLPTIMAAVFAMSGTKISEWLAALQKIHLPSFLLVPLAVLFRFFPTLLQDVKSIRQAMRFRGIALNGWSYVRHPLQTMEYFLIPLLMSAENTATELSATALVRGLSAKNPHTSVYSLQLKGADYAVFSSVIVLILLFVRM
jgi:energy-coupling factor transporter transmembrane protein EcfT